MYGYICPHCGDHLDPGEQCECRREKEERNSWISEMLSFDPDGQVVLKEVKQDAVQLG